MLRARLGSSQDTSYDPGQLTIGVAHSPKEPNVLCDQRFVYRSTLRIELVKQFHEKSMAAALELRTDSRVDLGRETLVFSFELLNQILIQGYRHLAFSQGHTPSLPE